MEQLPVRLGREAAPQKHRELPSPDLYSQLDAGEKPPASLLPAKMFSRVFHTQQRSLETKSIVLLPMKRPVPKILIYAHEHNFPKHIRAEHLFEFHCCSYGPCLVLSFAECADQFEPFLPVDEERGKRDEEQQGAQHDDHVRVVWKRFWKEDTPMQRSYPRFFFLRI